MRFVYAGSTGVAAAMALSMVAFAQEPAQPRGQAPAPAPAPATQQQERAKADSPSVTVVGCVQREADFRQAQDAGKGGVAGTGVGAGNEFVLIAANIVPAGGTGAAGAANEPGGKPTGTSGTASGTSYELSGSGEGQVANHVGKRVEIVGTLKPAEVGAAGPTGGPTAGAPPRGVDVASSDLKLRELDVISVKEASGACPAAAPSPATK